MPLNSKKKGNAGEREVVALHNAEGWTAHRNTQFTGANAESPDVSVAEFKFLWIEVKRQQRGVQPRAWLHTAETQAGAARSRAFIGDRTIRNGWSFSARKTFRGFCATSISTRSMLNSRKCRRSRLRNSTWATTPMRRRRQSGRPQRHLSRKCYE